MADKTYFGNIIRKERLNHSETMQQLAEALKTNKSTISMWENSGIVPREDMLIKIAQHYGVSVDYLLGNDSASNNDNDSETLRHLQRGLNQMNENELKRAEKLLASVFDDLFENPGDDINGI